MFSILTRPFTGPVGLAMWTKVVLTKPTHPGSIPVKLRLLFFKYLLHVLTKRLASAFRYSQDLKQSYGMFFIWCSYYSKHLKYSCV